SGRRVIAVGTTTLRVLETVAADVSRRTSSTKPIGSSPQWLPLIATGTGKTNIFIYPPCEFKIVDAFLTNFHLPRSTLLMLVSAFAAPGKIAGRDLTLSA